MRLSHLLLTIGLTLLIACQSTAHRPLPTPPALVRPSEGRAVIYIFRPSLDAVMKYDKPSLWIDDRAVLTEFRPASYAAFSLEPGSHIIALRPNRFDSSTWALQSKFEINSGQTYFVAIWHRDQPTPGTTVPNPVVGALIFVQIGGGFGSAGSVKFESVDQDVGLFGITGLEELQPIEYAAKRLE